MLAPDIVGFGYTDRPDGFAYTRQNWVDHLLGLLDALQVPTVSLVGNSFGGALALWLATTHPVRVHRLVLMGSAGILHPTLLVHGRDDQVIPLTTSLRLHHLISNSELHVFRRCGHWVQIEADTRFVELVDAFLTRRTPGR